MPEPRLERSERKNRANKTPHPVHHIHVSNLTSGRNCTKVSLAIPRSDIIHEHTSLPGQALNQQASDCERQSRAGEREGRLMRSTGKTFIKVEIEVT